METQQTQSKKDILSKSIFRQIYLMPTIIGLKSVPNTVVNDGVYFQQHIKLHSKQGHGFAAELANDLIDRIYLKNAYITGGNNAKNGYDRIVDNIKIQSKYCKTAEATFNACFDSQKKLRYEDQQIEVPPEQFELVKKKFVEKGYSQDIVRKGHISYNTAKKIAQFGTVQGLFYDSIQGVYVGMQGFTISSLILFTSYQWSGRPFKQSAQLALRNSIEVFNIQLTSHIITQQLCRTSINTSFNNSVFDLLGRCFSSNTFNKLAERLSKQEPYQQIAPLTAKTHLAKQIKGQIVFVLMIIIIQTIKELYQTLKYQKSWRLLGKKIISNLISTTGSFLFTIYGTIHFGKLGRFIFSLLGSLTTSILTKQVLDFIMKDDEQKLLDQIYNIILKYQEDHQLSQFQLLQLIDQINDQKIDIRMLNQMVQSNQPLDIVDNCQFDN